MPPKGASKNKSTNVNKRRNSQSPEKDTPPVKRSRSMSKAHKENTLNTFKTDLRSKYLNELDAIQRSAASDPEAWKDFENSVKRTQELQELVNSVDDLVLLENSEQNQNLNVNATNLGDEIACPVCFEDMVSPRSILVCSNGHPICSDCEQKIKMCPACRECYAHDGKPKRAKFAERLIAMYVESLKKE